MKLKCPIYIILIGSLLFSGCSKQDNAEIQPLETDPIVVNDILETEDPVPSTGQAVLEYKYSEMPDLEVDYIPELGYHGPARMQYSYEPYIFICWKNMLIIGDTIYRREDEIYKRTEERLQDWFDISDNIYNAYQWENLLIVEYINEIMVLDMNSGQLWTYPFDGYEMFVYQGKIYYRELGKGIYCMDPLSGEVEVIYACEGGGDFKIRDNGDMIISVIKGTGLWEFWLLSHDALGDLSAEKIWETDKYRYHEMLEINTSGLFFLWEGHDKRDGLLCLKDNGEREEMVLEEGWLSLAGQIIVDEGYFLWDSQILSEEEKVEILGSWSWERPREVETVVDSISYYDFQGNKLQTWQLIEDEMLEAGYRLKCIVYGNGEMLAFYENEELDDLFISKVHVN